MKTKEKLAVEDLKTIASFFKIIKNYSKMKRLIKEKDLDK